MDAPASQLVLQDGAIVIRWAIAAGPFQIDDEADPAHRDGQGVADRGFVAYGFEVVVFWLILHLEARLQGGASEKPDQCEQRGPQHPLHGQAANASQTLDLGTMIHRFAPEGWHPERAGSHPGPSPLCRTNP